MFILGCESEITTEANIELNQPTLVILGNIQDAGAPHIGCIKVCCKNLSLEDQDQRRVTSLGLIDPQNQKTYIFEASPDMPSQIEHLNQVAGHSLNRMPDGIFLSHAHIGHYTGLMYLGKEAINTKEVPVFAMPKMNHFLSNHGPWSQLVHQKNISLKSTNADSTITLTNDISITPFLVPHRDEYSETVGFKIHGPKKTVLFIPDIDKWSKWSRDIKSEIEKVDYAFIDGTFFHGQEINMRDVSQIPHPFIEESMRLFKDLTASEKDKIHFIHFNHTNPVLNKASEAYKALTSGGFNMAEFNQLFTL